MKYMQKYTIFLVGVFIITLSIFPMFAAADYPPEWIYASDHNVTTGDTTSGSYRNTYSHDFSYHTIKCASGGWWGPWEAVVFYEFYGKCSQVRIWVTVDPLIYGNCFSAKAYYTTGSPQDLGYFNPQNYYTFNLESCIILTDIRIQYYLSWNPVITDRYIKIDYISCYWTGRL